MIKDIKNLSRHCTLNVEITIVTDFYRQNIPSLKFCFELINDISLNVWPDEIRVLMTDLKTL